MANRICQIDEKVQPVEIALAQINVEAAARKAGVPPNTLAYDLNKVKEALPDTLANRRPGPQRRCEARDAKRDQAEEAVLCPDCGGKTVKNGIYWILNWVMMLTMGWMGVQRV